MKHLIVMCCGCVLIAVIGAIATVPGAVEALCEAGLLLIMMYVVGYIPGTLLVNWLNAPPKEEVYRRYKHHKRILK